MMNLDFFKELVRPITEAAELSGYCVECHPGPTRSDDSFWYKLDICFIDKTAASVYFDVKEGTFTIDHPYLYGRKITYPLADPKCVEKIMEIVEKTLRRAEWRTMAHRADERP